MDKKVVASFDRLIRALSDSKRNELKCLILSDSKLISRAWMTLWHKYGELAERTKVQEAALHIHLGTSYGKLLKRRMDEGDEAWGKFFSVLTEISHIQPLTLAKEVAREGYDGKWPSSFLRCCPPKTLALVLGVLGELEEKEAEIVARNALTYTEPFSWEEIFNVLLNSSKNEVAVLVANFFDDLLAVSVAGGFFPFVNNTQLLTKKSFSDDPRGQFVLEPIKWKIPDEASPLGLAIIKEFVKQNSFPEKELKLFYEYAKNEDACSQEIARLWDEIRDAGKADGKKTLRHWVTGGGNTKFSFEIGGIDGNDIGIFSGVVEDTNPFPHLTVNLNYGFFFKRWTEVGRLEHGGRLSTVDDFPKGSSQRGLRLLQNYAIVRELHCVAFATPQIISGKSSSNGSANGDGTRGKIAHLRRLPEGWHASEEALARVPEGLALPKGGNYTYVASPPLKPGQTAPKHEPIELSVSVNSLLG